MKIINLTMQAFGPFKDKISIDFDKFNNGVYLISGNTGSGKTTIFDAITFALFGDSSGGERDESMIRFVASDPSVETYVKLEFEYKGKIVKIRRTPKYEREKKRGEGLTSKGSKKTIVEVSDGKIIDDLKEADQFIINLLGVDSIQFRQIVMLAQGNFMKLLKASNEEKSKLFRKIFFTEKYNKLEFEISNKLKEISKKRDELKSVRDEILSNFKYDIENQEKFEESKNISIEEVINNINTVNEKYALQYDLLSEKILKLQKVIDSKKYLFEKVESYNLTKEKITKLEDQFENINLNFIKYKEKYNNISTIEKDLENINSKINQLNIEKEKFIKLNDINKKIEVEQENHVKISKNISLKKEILYNINNQISEIDDFLKNNKNVEKQISDNKLKIKDLELSINSLEKYTEIINNVLKEERNKDNLIKEYEKLKPVIKKKHAKYEDAEEVFFESQAGILAKNLDEGMPCPVCGSLEHPNLAKFKDDLPDKKFVDKLKKEFEKYRNELENIKNEINSSDKTINIYNNQILEFNEYKDLNNNESLILSEKLNNDYKLLKIEKSNLENIEKLIVEKNIEKEDILDSKKKIEYELKELNDNIIKFDQNIKNLNEQKNEEINKLGNKSEVDVDKKMSDLMENKKTYTEEINVIREKYLEYSKNHTEISKTLELLKLQLDDKYNVDINDLEIELRELEIKLKYENMTMSDIHFNLEINKTQLKKLQNNLDNSKSVEKKYLSILELNDVIKGKVSGTSRIKFETFVQTIFLDEILYHANLRFNKMTNEKYSLKRKTEASNLMEQWGLDLEVVDHHNRSERNINTLSGGESFQAALSLALGLSDVVQMQRGGIELNSMFIDEGFGTLDRDTLSKVMSTLFDISQNNKLIGIISHVETLKEQIDKKILVEKSVDGVSTLI
ncbi:SMC family ATPase [Helcococcus bovis]|uniref:AAA family ATPase n=1 Tax=Helcococcus bovis TaxID=3153252 RepID=UPI0038B709DE